MSRIFLSHSSIDNFAARALANWLAEEGWTDVFLDVDPERGIAAGQRWERSLHQAADRCEAVIFIVTRPWLASGWCRKEYELARSLNKQLFAVVAERGLGMADLPPELKDTWQVTDLVAGADHRIFRATLPSSEEERHVSFSRAGLARLQAGLKKAGLDAREFAWPPKGMKDPAPYVGLRALGADEAGLFFGRDADLVKALDRLRGLSEATAPRVAVILGSSGAGKSSFLRAGLLPRMARDDARFLCLPVIRPARDPIEGDTGLVAALDTVVTEPHARADIRAAVSQGPDRIRAVLAPLLQATAAKRLVDQETGRPPVVVIPVDQAEELFSAETDGTTFLALLAALATDDTLAVMLLFAIRSDAYDALEQAKALEGLSPLALPLLPMPRHAARAIIEGPAARYAASGRKLDLDPRLTQALLDDLDKDGGRDTLPLLAFSLEHLWREYGGTGALTSDQYEALGGVAGAIEAGVRRAYARADIDPSIPRDMAARDTLVRRGLVPWLAGIDPDTRAPRRMVARAEDIPAESKPLIDLLVEERLLSRSLDEANAVTIEPVHEALLRQWGKLKGWLDEDFALLAALEAVQRASRDWDANGRAEPWLAHRGQRLTEAASLDKRLDLAAKLGLQGRAYLAACRAHEDALGAEAERVQDEREQARERELRDARTLADANRRWTKAVAIGLVGALVLALLTACGGGFALYLRGVANHEAENAAQKAREADEAAAKATKAAEEAKRQSARADAQARDAFRNQAGALAALSSIALQKSPTLATKLALAAWPKSSADPTPKLAVTLSALSEAVPLLRERLIFRGHDDSVINAVFSPDGTRVVTGSSDNTARVWDAATGRQIAVLKGHDNQVYSAVFSPDGTRVVTASEDNTARVWGAVTGQQIAVLKGHDDGVGSAAFSPDGTQVVTASGDKTARVWDAETGRQIAVLKGHDYTVLGAAFSPDGTRVVTASEDRTARVWDAETGLSIAVLKGHDNQVTGAAFSPDGTRVVTASWDKTARVWNAATGLPIAVLKGHDNQVISAAFSLDGTRVITASGDKTARVWDAATGLSIAVLQIHGNWATSAWVTSATFSPDGTRVITKSSDNTSQVWDVATGRQITVFKGHDDGDTSLTFSLDGTRLLTVSEDKTVRIWDVATGLLIAVLKGHDNHVHSAVFSPDSTRVITKSFDNTPQIWDAATGRLIALLRGHVEEVATIAFSPDSTRVVTASEDKTARVWDAETGRPIAVLKGHDDGVYSAAFSPDGTRVVTASEDKTARVWDATTGRQITMLKGHGDIVFSASFSPDGTRVVTASLDETARVWDTTTGQATAVLKGHNREVTCATFSPDGTRVVTASEDGTARVWDAATGLPIATLKGHENKVASARFSRDGMRVLTASTDGTARIWDISSIPKGDIFHVSCAWLPDHDLTNIAREYGLINLAPICEDNPPLPDPPTQASR